MTSSVIYDSFTDDLCNNAIDPATDTYYGLLVDGYTPNAGTDEKRSDADADEVTGVGYTAGGEATACTLAKNTSLHQETMTFANIVWTTATITATGLVIYKHRGGLATADNLVCYVDFGGSVSSVAGTFTAECTSPLTFQN
jgi:hypothetical protein